MAAGSAALDAGGIREIVRAHAERIAEDLAGVKADRGEIVRIVREETERAFGLEPAGGRPASRRARR